MEFLEHLFYGVPNSWGGGVAHSVLILSLVIAIGIMLGKIKIAGVSIGATWILFVGIAFGHFGLNIDEHLLHFVKEFGLILFVFSIGLQVGPGFFSAFKKGGLSLNLVAVGTVLLGVLTTIALHYITGEKMTTMVGILSGAITNTPGLGAAQQAYSEVTGGDSSHIAMAYAVAYPLGVVGIILSLLLLKYICRINPQKEEEALTKGDGQSKDTSVSIVTVEILNSSINGRMLSELRRSVKREFVVTRVKHGEEIVLANAQTKLYAGDKILIITNPNDLEGVTLFFGKQIEMNWETENVQFISRKILITKEELNGKTLSQIKVRQNFSATITRVNRAGVDLVASPTLQLQVGDRVTVVGSEVAVRNAEKVLGNSLKRLDHPNLIPIFIGIALGCILGSIPVLIPGIPQPVKLGLAGGPLVVSILISRFGPQYKIVTYTTMSANLMIREVGISLFLACVGLGAGGGFIHTIVEQGGYVWVGYGVIITVLPLLVMGIVAKYFLKLNYYTLIGVLSGATTDPPALAYSNDQTSSDAPAVGYATVYPLTMFLRVLTAQLLILAFL